MLSVPRGIGYESPSVNLPQPCSRELRRIRLYDTANIDTVFFVISELQEVSFSSNLTTNRFRYLIWLKVRVLPFRCSTDSEPGLPSSHRDL